jgi:hypothetical protein
MISKPTIETYTELQQAYDWFNDQLFSGQLPNCIITLQREKKTYGYFSKSRFVNVASGARTDEIALNPVYFSVCPAVEIMQTLVHEMTHLWQHHFGNPGRGRYHNIEWSEKMQAIGLMPSSTGEPGGKVTGDSMADYVISGGAFEQSYNMLVTDDFKVRWYDAFPPRELMREALTGGVYEGELSLLVDGGIVTEQLSEELPINKSHRSKYTCPGCQINAWGKPGLNLICGSCSFALNDVTNDILSL